MCASLLADAAHWRARAHAARTIAKDMAAQMATKRRMKEIAAEFDEFAQQAEQRAAGMQTVLPFDENGTDRPSVLRL
jgi:hypothetical protein